MKNTGASLAFVAAVSSCALELPAGSQGFGNQRQLLGRLPLFWSTSGTAWLHVEPKCSISVPGQGRAAKAVAAVFHEVGKPFELQEARRDQTVKMAKPIDSIVRSPFLRS